MKPPKFLLAKNPIADKSDGRIFILHTQTPKILAEVFHFDVGDEEHQMDCKRQFTIGSTLEYEDEYIVIGALWVESCELFSADRLAGLMRRMADWYEAYLIWEDSQDYEVDNE